MRYSKVWHFFHAEIFDEISHKNSHKLLSASIHARTTHSG